MKLQDLQNGVVSGKYHYVDGRGPGVQKFEDVVLELVQKLRDNK